MSDETTFLAAIRATPADNLTRLVYADWLDEHDRPGGAFLRAECELATLGDSDTRRANLQAALREAAVGVDSGWLAAVSRVPVENCGVEFRFRCPKRWEQLQQTSDETVRFCDECRRQVMFCPSIELAQTHAALGDCIAVDPRLARTPRDLESNLWGSDTLVMGMPALDENEVNPKGDDPLPRRRRGRG